MSNVKGLLNCLVRFKVTSLRDLAGMAGKRSASPNLFDTEGWPEVKNPKLVRKVKKNMENQTMEGKTLEKNLVEENIETKKTIAKGCSDCDVLNNSVGDFDKRQDLFSQVIGEELKLIQPCIRTRTFIRIMNFLDNTKNIHSNDVQLSESEKSNWHNT
ncbi:hypothetical protein ACJJTC_009010 [Scirpophaga incertulas]